jgi:signal transduction histidine kinase
VIHNRRPELIQTKAEAKKWYSELDHQDYIGNQFASWIGAPMIYGEQVLGVIAVYHETEEYKYDQDDLEVLEILAGQVAVAIQNLRFHEAWISEQEKANAANRLSVISAMGAEFAHRMNNVAGTIPAWVEMAKEKLKSNNPRDVEIRGYLDQVSQNVQLLLDAAKVIKKNSEKQPSEFVEINELVEIGIGRAITTQPGSEKRITIIKNLTSDLPKIELEREKLLDTLTNIIKNGLQAIPDTGVLTISTQRSKTDSTLVEILVADTGVGISPDNLEKIFDLLYTTKGADGLGYGLWRDKSFIKTLGGDIVVHSETSKGTVFTIKIPANTGKVQIAGKVRSDVV